MNLKIKPKEICSRCEVLQESNRSSLCRECEEYWNRQAWDGWTRRREYLLSPEGVDRNIQVDDSKSYVNEIDKLDFDFSWLTPYLDRLSPRQREIAELYFWLGRTLGQIADELGISKGTVQRRLSEALKRLRYQIIQEGAYDLHKYIWEGKFSLFARETMPPSRELRQRRKANYEKSNFQMVQA